MAKFTVLPGKHFCQTYFSCLRQVWGKRRPVIIIVMLMSLAACSSTQIKPWGASTTFSPGWQQIKRGAKESFYNPETWVPLAGAAIFGFTELDQKVSDYAIDYGPIYGRSNTAIDKSDDVFVLTKLALFTTSLATAGADNFEDTVRFKGRGLTAQSIAIGLNNFFTGELKVLAKRIPPNQINDDSLTSRHASGAFLYSSLSRYNVRHITTDRFWQNSADAMMIGLASVTAWGRVEGGLHYPSDVLVGAAMGNFFANFIHYTFVAPDEPHKYSLEFSKTHVSSRLTIKVRF